MQDGYLESTLLQTMSLEEVLWDWHAQGIHSHWWRESSQETEDRRKSV